MIIFDLIFGFLLIFAGRSLFWLCVGVIGFLIGVQCAVSSGYYSNGWTALVIAFALGSLGAVLAMSFEWVMVIFGVGFLGGGYLLMNIFPSLAGQEPYSWLIFVVGGIVGMCLMIIIFDWTLIMISSLLGATLIVHAFYGVEAFREPLFIGCMVTGILVQYLTLKDTAHQKRPARSSTRRHRQYAGSSQGEYDVN
jgi:hypothetical protein